MSTSRNTGTSSIPIRFSQSHPIHFSPKAVTDASHHPNSFPCVSQNVPDPRSKEEMIEGVRSRLLETVRIRLPADVPVGVYLSGVIDSSVIAGMVVNLVNERGEQLGNDSAVRNQISCFSIEFDDDGVFNEGRSCPLSPFLFP